VWTMPVTGDWARARLERRSGRRHLSKRASRT
jgi:hypothetical protein